MNVFIVEFILRIAFLFVWCWMYARVSGSTSTLDPTMSWIHMSPSIRIWYQLPLLILHYLYVIFINELACSVRILRIISRPQRQWHRVLALQCSNSTELRQQCCSRTAALSRCSTHCHSAPVHSLIPSACRASTHVARGALGAIARDAASSIPAADIAAYLLLT